MQRLFSISTSEKPLYCLFSQKLWYIPEKDNLCIHAVGLMVCFSFMNDSNKIWDGEEANVRGGTGPQKRMRRKGVMGEANMEDLIFVINSHG